MRGHAIRLRLRDCAKIRGSLQEYQEQSAQDEIKRGLNSVMRQKQWLSYDQCPQI